MRCPDKTEEMTLPEKIILPNGLLLSDVAAMLSEGRSVLLRAKGNSMYPFIVGGRDKVVLQKEKQIRVGDIVLAYLGEKGYVLHRIYRIEDKRIVLMGDGNVSVTETCLQENICGKVLKIVRNGRYVDCDSPGECRKVRVWSALRPFRRYILAACRYWRKKTG
jgi:Peptidase S24-like.